MGNKADREMDGKMYILFIFVDINLLYSWKINKSMSVILKRSSMS